MPINNNNLNKSKLKSSRKPLKEIPNANGNGVRFSSKQSNKKKSTLKKEEKQPKIEENVVDRLLFVHSNLSTLINQIDELVVQAVKVEGTNKKGQKEIDLFTNILSDMHSSLEPWIPRFQNLLTSPIVEPVSKSVQSSPAITFPIANEKMRNVDDSPLDSFVSPSPLVSWCPVESERQMFMFSPLPRSTQLSFIPTSLKSENPHINTNLETSSLVEESKGKNLCSPPTFVNRNRLMNLMTPPLKMSPPKSCVVLEPIKDSVKPNTTFVSRKTPFPARSKPHYPPTPYRQECPISPPKSCALLEPLNGLSKACSTSKLYLECTPISKAPESTFKSGKKPGENTLKQELWTRFEAATTAGTSNALRLDVSVLDNMSRKGFLDRLEEEIEDSRI